MSIRPLLWQVKKRLLLARVRLRFWLDVYQSAAEPFRFVCNVCGTTCRVPVSAMSRERLSCYGCGSTIRFRSVANALSIALEIGLKPLTANPARKSIVGIGMSDSECYAGKLEKKFSYRNTYYHKEPKLDILSLDISDHGSVDFIICSDVLEHVAPPVHVAFQNLFRLLKRGGVLVLTVPLADASLAGEHFPGLGEYHFEFRGDRRVLVNKTASGSYEEFSELVFHGGEGETLEMRLFSKEWLLKELKDAGFARVRVLDEEYPDFGIVWRQDISVPLVAWK